MRVIRLAILAILCLMIVGSTAAQDASNLLINGGFEEGSFGPYTGRRSGEKPIYLPGGWNAWLPASPRGDYYDRSDRVTINPHPETGFPKPLKGLRAVAVDCGFVTCTVAIYQTVSTGITAGANVRATAWATLKACNSAPDKKTGLPTGICESAAESGAKTRIGIDPNGGSDPNDTDIVWGGFISPHMQGGWQSMSVDATATGTSVTLFLYSTQQNFAEVNITYWDEVVLAGGGGGGSVAPAATPVPTPIPQVAFVVPQAAQGDGSIVHTVQAGDTVDSIAFAYGVTRTQILELNNLASPRYINPGQKLVIKTPEPAASSGGDAPAAVTPEVTPTISGVTFEDVVATLAPTDGAPEQAPVQEVQPAAVEPTQPTEATQPPLPAPVTEVASNAINPASTTGAVCVLLFDDLNQNRIQESGETALAGGTINLSQAGQPVESYQTDAAPDPHCFADLSIGDYVAVAAAPGGYGLTTSNQFRVQLSPGATINVAFGAAQGVAVVAPPPADVGGLVEEAPASSDTPRSLADQILQYSGLIIFGLAALVLLGGLGVALAMRRR